MYKVTFNALRSFIGTITVNEQVITPVMAYASKRVKPAANISDLEQPRITIHRYHKQYDPTRIHHSATYEFDDDITADSTSIDSIPCPEPWLLFYQVEFRTRGSRVQHDIDEFETAFLWLFDGKAKDITITYSCAGHTINKTCHVKIENIKDGSSNIKNQRKGRIIYSLSVQTWLWPDIDTPDTSPLIKRRIFNRLNPGTQDDTDISYTSIFDQED